MIRNLLAALCVVVVVAAVPLVAHAGPPKPIKKPATKWKIGATSLSTVDDNQIAAALKAALAGEGYAIGSVDASTACVWEGRFVYLTKATTKFEVYFKRPWAKPDEPCNPKEATGPGDDSVGEEATRAYDKKSEVVLWVRPSFDATTTPEQKTQLQAEAKKLFDLIFKP